MWLISQGRGRNDVRAEVAGDQDWGRGRRRRVGMGEAGLVEGIVCPGLAYWVCTCRIYMGRCPRESSWLEIMVKMKL